jgi:hypothetical protein
MVPQIRKEKEKRNLSAKTFLITPKIEDTKAQQNLLESKNAPSLGRSLWPHPFSKYRLRNKPSGSSRSPNTTNWSKLGFFTHKNALNSSTAYSSKWLPLVRATSPSLTEMQMILVAGHDSMLMKLSGAHGPYFTRNIAILKDSAGNTGGEKIRQTLEDARPSLDSRSGPTRRS